MGKKKKVKPGIIELHPTEPIIIVNYEMQFVNVDDNGEQHVTEKQYSHKKIKIKSFNLNSNIPKIAKGVIEHCKYIHASKENHIISILEELKQRLINPESDDDDDEDEPSEEAEDDDEKSENDGLSSEKYKELQMQLEHERNLRLEKERELQVERERINEKLQREQEEKQKLAEIQQQELLKEKERSIQREADRKKLEFEQKRMQKKEKKKMKKIIKQQLKIEKEMERNMPKIKANIDDLDKYIENLYENDVKIKISATYHILQFVQVMFVSFETNQCKLIICAIDRNQIIYRNLWTTKC